VLHFSALFNLNIHN